MMTEKHKVFISYHHKNDQMFKEELLRLNDQYDIFIDRSVDTGDIDEDLSDDSIRQKIRDEYLRDSTITILLVGLETKNRKHIDWEIYSSMYDGQINKKSGVIVVNLPSISCGYFTAPHGDTEKKYIYPTIKKWITIDSRADYDCRYPHMPARIIDNLLASSAKISVINWERLVEDHNTLALLIELAHKERGNCDYVLSTPMRRINS